MRIGHFCSAVIVKVYSEDARAAAKEVGGLRQMPNNVSPTGKQRYWEHRDMKQSSCKSAQRYS